MLHARPSVRGDACDIPGVLERMAAIDASTTEDDGVSIFNRLYGKVTEAVLSEVEGAGYEDDAFLTELDVVFANLYFDAYAAAAQGGRCAPPWRPLFERRHEEAAPIQFAMAGMNAHINHDLPVAVVDTCARLSLVPEPETPHHRDYTRTNDVLALVQERIKDWFAMGAIAAIDDACGKVDDALARWSIAKARHLAWENAETLWALQDNPRLLEGYRRTLQRTVHWAGTGLLL